MALTGCSVLPPEKILADFSSSAIGCPSSEITVSSWEYHRNALVTEYFAECHGKKFVCNKANDYSLGNFAHTYNPATCKEMLK
jgi:hypothetical protein